MQFTAKWSFEVNLVPQELAISHDLPGLSRMSIEKRYSGTLEATGRGEMLSFNAQVKGSAGYVAIERVTGTLQGRRGSFVIQHSGTMNRGIPSLTIAVVPDSGTEELAGLQGTMAIDSVDGRHSYTLQFDIPS